MMTDKFYAWLTVLVLPINSALNPLIYTFTTPSFTRKLREHTNTGTRFRNVRNMLSLSAGERLLTKVSS
jgi:hypothetical protein